MTNDIVLCLNNGQPSHFKLREFANAEGVAMVHPRLLSCLEELRGKLCAKYGREVWIIITDATRTRVDNEALGARLGWIDEGGVVSRESKHLTKYGGIAADIKAFFADPDPSGYRFRIPQSVVGEEARWVFAYVKDDYGDGHVHVDCWDRVMGTIMGTIR